MTLRAILSAAAALVAFYFTLWVVGGLLLPAGTPIPIRFVISLAVAVAAGRAAWLHITAPPVGLASAVVKGALIVGGIGFAAGFFGPIVFTPGANQGPLLGILITGPLGFVAGGIGGGCYWLWSARRDRH